MKLIRQNKTTTNICCHKHKHKLSFLKGFDKIVQVTNLLFHSFLFLIKKIKIKYNNNNQPFVTN